MGEPLEMYVDKRIQNIVEIKNRESVQEVQYTCRKVIRCLRKAHTCKILICCAPYNRTQKVQKSFIQHTHMQNHDLLCSSSKHLKKKTYKHPHHGRKYCLSGGSYYLHQRRDCSFRFPAGSVAYIPTPNSKYRATYNNAVLCFKVVLAF